MPCPAGQGSGLARWCSKFDLTEIHTPRSACSCRWLRRQGRADPSTWWGRRTGEAFFERHRTNVGRRFHCRARLAPWCRQLQAAVQATTTAQGGAQVSERWEGAQVRLSATASPPQALCCWPGDTCGAAAMIQSRQCHTAPADERQAGLLHASSRPDIGPITTVALSPMITCATGAHVEAGVGANPAQGSVGEPFQPLVVSSVAVPNVNLYRQQWVAVRSVSLALRGGQAANTGCWQVLRQGCTSVVSSCATCNHWQAMCILQEAASLPTMYPPVCQR